MYVPGLISVSICYLFIFVVVVVVAVCFSHNVTMPLIVLCSVNLVILFKLFALFFNILNFELTHKLYKSYVYHSTGDVVISTN